MAYLRRFLAKAINLPLGMAGLELLRKSHNWEDVEQFLPFKETIEGAKEAGLSLGDYIDVKYNVPGATRETIRRITKLGVFDDKIDCVCEIGPGSGRYLDLTLRACSPSHYEVYETASDWAEWLVRTYKVILRPTDGKSLSHTPSNSIDLVQAHKVFVCTPFLTTCRYLTEITRVCRPGARVVFDIVTEGCMDNVDLEAWLKSGIQLGSYPCLMPRKYVIDFFQERSFGFIDSFYVPMAPGRTECMVFKKELS